MAPAAFIAEGTQRNWIIFHLDRIVRWVICFRHAENATESLARPIQSIFLKDWPMYKLKQARYAVQKFSTIKPNGKQFVCQGLGELNRVAARKSYAQHAGMGYSLPGRVGCAPIVAENASQKESLKTKETEPFKQTSLRIEHRMIQMGRDGQPRAVVVEIRKKRRR